MQPPGSVIEPAAPGAVRPTPARLAALERHRPRVAAALVFAVALFFRLGVILRKGGIHGIMGYDCGVYFAGADALLHGRLPYRDFTMVHPPGITLALTPFAALTKVMTDWHAFEVATLAFCLIGATDAVLVSLVCRRLGIATRGAVVAGLFYAVWYGSIGAEFQVKLEPLGNLLFLCGLLALLRDERRSTRWSAFLAGAVVGLPVAVKIWWIVPVLLVIGWHGMRRGSVRAGGEVLLGAAASVTAVCLPFFVADPSGMWRSVITGQLGRPRTKPITKRLADLSTIPDLMRHLTTSELQLIATAVVVGLATLLALGWRGSRRARFLSVVSVVQLGVLLLSPSWFGYYCDYLAVGLAVTVGAAVVAVRRPSLVSSPARLITVGLLAITALVTVAGTTAPTTYDGAAKLTRVVSGDRCVMSNNQTVLLRLDALSRGLADGCPNWIDVSGRDMGPDSPAALKSAHSNWTLALLRYLRSGDAAVMWPNDYYPGVRAGLRQDGVLAQIGPNVIYRHGSHP
ncbi:glycosyltransferase 87 family protein [Flexivirga alba]|uniref:Glycosyltransferase 87 family protein n=1 Tax=Flexivirga alba TaxID=702742 RepID=A0ABW2ADR5_9MICO